MSTDNVNKLKEVAISALKNLNNPSQTINSIAERDGNAVLLMVDEMADKMTEYAMTNFVQESAGIRLLSRRCHRSNYKDDPERLAGKHEAVLNAAEAAKEVQEKLMVKLRQVNEK